MKINKILLILASNPCLAEVFYYGDHYLTVDLRSDQPTILKFEKVPLSSSCQPGVLRFQPLDQKELNLGEQQRVQETIASETEKDTTVSQLIRVTPQEKSGIVTCSFTLAGGDEVPVRFSLTDGIARPFINLRPVAEKYTPPQINNDLGLLQSLIKGDSIYLHEITKDFDSCEGSFESNAGECKHLKFSTSSADYELTYVGTDTSIKAWTLSVRLKAPLAFAKIADLNAKNGSNILYSAVTPQKDLYEKGDRLKHYILTNTQMTKLELKEAMP